MKVPAVTGGLLCGLCASLAIFAVKSSLTVSPRSLRKVHEDVFAFATSTAGRTPSPPVRDIFLNLRLQQFQRQRSIPQNRVMKIPHIEFRT